MNQLKYLIDVSDMNKAGLFYSVLERISRTKSDFVVINLSFYDSWLISIVKRIFCAEKKNKKKTFVYKNIEVIPVHLKRGLLEYILIAAGMTDMVRRLDAKRMASKGYVKEGDIIYAHWGVSAGLVGYHLKQILSCKLIICLHGSDIHTIPTERSDIRYSLMNALRVSNQNVFVSHALLKSAQGLGYEGDNYTVIYNGVEDSYGLNLTNADSERFKNKYGLNTATKIPLIGYIGNLKYVKGADRLPEITKEVVLRLPNCKFIIAGNGELRDVVEGVCSNTKFVGHIDRNEVALLLRIIDVLILPSRNEGLPLIIAEAKKSGVSVVASNVGGVNEILETENCIACGDRFVDRFSERIVNVINDGEASVDLSSSFLWKNILEQENDMISDVRNEL